jgi:hypothetical protein
MVGNDPLNNIDALGLIDYDFNEKKCRLTVKVTWSLTFQDYRDNKWGGWSRWRWRSKAESAVGRYFKKQTPKCFSSLKDCCICKDGVSFRVGLRYVDSGADYAVTVVKDDSHRSWADPAHRVSELDSGDVNPQGKGASEEQVPVVHEFGHMLGLDQPGGRSNNSTAYNAAPDSLMGRGMTLRLPDFIKAFCRHLSTGKKCNPWKGK